MTPAQKASRERNQYREYLVLLIYRYSRSHSESAYLALASKCKLRHLSSSTDKYGHLRSNANLKMFIFVCWCLSWCKLKTRPCGQTEWLTLKYSIRPQWPDSTCTHCQQLTSFVNINQTTLYPLLCKTSRILGNPQPSGLSSLVEAGPD